MGGSQPALQSVGGILYIEEKIQSITQPPQRSGAVTIYRALPINMYDPLGPRDSLGIDNCLGAETGT